MYMERSHKQKSVVCTEEKHPVYIKEVILQGKLNKITYLLSVIMHLKTTLFSRVLSVAKSTL